MKLQCCEISKGIDFEGVIFVRIEVMFLNELFIAVKDLSSINIFKRRIFLAVVTFEAFVLVRLGLFLEGRRQ